MSENIPLWKRKCEVLPVEVYWGLREVGIIAKPISEDEVLIQYPGNVTIILKGDQDERQEKV
ncbi:MAG: hypothetical protein ACXABY_01130 [Candidatus Thorarchaeota archaeon]|jgi:hypothetical protein